MIRHIPVGDDRRPPVSVAHGCDRRRERERGQSQARDGGTASVSQGARPRRPAARLLPSNGYDSSVMSRLLAPAALVLAALASGCGDEPPPSGKAVAAEREWKRLVVLVDGKRSTWAVDVPVAAGWTEMTFKGHPGVATITRPFAKGCELFLQVVVVGSSAGAPEVGPPRSRIGVERVDRTVVVETPSGEQHFDVATHVARPRASSSAAGRRAWAASRWRSSHRVRRRAMCPP